LHRQTSLSFSNNMHV